MTEKMRLMRETIDSQLFSVIIVLFWVNISQPRATFNISYIGQMKWGGLEPYVRAAYTLAEGHVMLEVVNVGQRFCISFFLVTPGHKYIRSFRQALDAENIAYTINGPFKKNLPGVELPTSTTQCR